MMSEYELISIGIFGNLFLGAIALVGLFLLLRVRDKMLGFDFKEWINDVKKNDPTVLVVYFSSWIIAGGYILGQVVSG